MSRIGLLFVCLSSCLAQLVRSDPSGGIRGTLAGDDGTALVGAHVTLHRVPPHPAGRLRTTDWATVTGDGGSFRFLGLSEGTYRLCAQMPRSAWLNPCEWGLRPPTVLLSGAHPTADITMVMAKGAIVTIRVEDPEQVLSQNEGTTPGALLLIGIPNDAMVFRRAAPVSRDGNSGDQQIVVPFDTTVKLVVSSSFYRLSDQAGKPFPSTAVHIPVLVPSGRSPGAIVVRVTGRR